MKKQYIFVSLCLLSMFFITGCQNTEESEPSFQGENTILISTDTENIMSFSPDGQESDTIEIKDFHTLPETGLPFVSLQIRKENAAGDILESAAQYGTIGNTFFVGDAQYLIVGSGQTQVEEKMFNQLKLLKLNTNEIIPTKQQEQIALVKPEQIQYGIPNDLNGTRVFLMHMGEGEKRSETSNMISIVDIANLDIDEKSTTKKVEVTTGDVFSVEDTYYAVLEFDYPNESTEENPPSGGYQGGLWVMEILPKINTEISEANKGGNQAELSEETQHIIELANVKTIFSGIENRLENGFVIVPDLIFESGTTEEYGVLMQISQDAIEDTASVFTGKIGDTFKVGDQEYKIVKIELAENRESGEKGRSDTIQIVKQ
jgi:hypothetical protein